MAIHFFSPATKDTIWLTDCKANHLGWDARFIISFFHGIRIASKNLTILEPIKWYGRQVHSKATNTNLCSDDEFEFSAAAPSLKDAELQKCFLFLFLLMNTDTFTKQQQCTAEMIKVLTISPLWHLKLTINWRTSGFIEQHRVGKSKIKVSTKPEIWSRIQANTWLGSKLCGS